MEDLIVMAQRGGNGARWDEHFKTLLLLLLETLGDQQVCNVTVIIKSPVPTAVNTPHIAAACIKYDRIRF